MVSFCVFLENDKTDLCQIFFLGLGENTFSLQPALKSNAPGLSFIRHILTLLLPISEVKRK